MAKARNRISSPNGATITPASNDKREAQGVARRWQRADGRDREEAQQDARDDRSDPDDRDRPQRAAADVAEGLRVEPPDAHRAPVERARVDDEQAHQPDVDERLDRDRQERAERSVERHVDDVERDRDDDPDQEGDGDRRREDQER